MGKDPDGIAAHPLLVQVESTVDGLPSGEVLAAATLKPADIAGTVPEYPLTLVVFPAPAMVTAGTRYAFVLRTSEVARPYVMAATDAPSPAGQVLVIDGGAGWTALDGTTLIGLELRFQTLVTRPMGREPWPIQYHDFGGYAMCDFDDGTRDLCPDQAHPYVPCYLSDGRTVLCSDRD